MAEDLPHRLHVILSRISRERGDPDEMATLGEAAARITLLERRVAELQASADAVGA